MGNLFRKPAAVANVSGGSTAPCLWGTVKFYRMGKYVLVAADICGLPKSQTDIFAMHIHEGPDCEGEKFANTGMHFNPTATLHPNHAGDLPVLFSCDGRAYAAVLTGRFGICDVVGRTVVIHSQPDDFKTQPAGNAGEKIGCGVILST